MVKKTYQIHSVKLAIGAVVLLGVGFAGGFATKSHMVKDAQAHLDVANLDDLYSRLRSDFDGNLDMNKLQEGAKAGLVAAAGDPYTVFLNAAASKELSDDLNGTVTGIGAEVGVKNSKLTIVSPIDDSPAAKAGLRSGDVIGKIDSTDPSGLTLDEAVGKIRGAKGTKVKLTIIRGTDAPFDVTITRDEITVASVKWSMKPNNVGYIQVSRFGPDTADLFNKAGNDLKSQGAKSIVIDLRNNPGGYLDAAVKMGSEFIKSGDLVVEERKGNKSIDKLMSTGTGELSGMKTIILINEGSASASEILSGALHDHKAATLVGAKSFGKGSVQEIEKLPGGAQLKVTVAHWFTPAGVNIGHEGIKPDVSVPLTTDDYNNSRDPQLDKALELANQ